MRNYKDKKNPHYIDGRTNKKYYCVDCGKKINYRTWHFEQQKCSSCVRKRNKYAYIDGRSLKKRYCVECGKRITRGSKLGRCKSCSSKGKLGSMFGKVTHGKRETYKGITMRSSWEIAYAKYLDYLNITWQYESKTFDLGNCTYTPDFYLPVIDSYIEIKGYWRDKAYRKFIKFKKLYPDIKIKVYDKRELKLWGIL